MMDVVCALAVLLLVAEPGTGSAGDPAQREDAPAQSGVSPSSASGTSG